MMVGCVAEPELDDLRVFTENAFKDQKPDVEPLPPLRPHAVFIYTASDMVDPFDQDNLKEKQTDTDAADDAEGPDRSRRKEPLEAFPLDALLLVGMLDQQGEKWAVVRAPDQSIHRVKQGNYMGVNYGEIVEIGDTSLTVTELVRNPVGKWESKDADLILVE
jgi:type IV pilus assembly protein PilP